MKKALILGALLALVFSLAGVAKADTCPVSSTNCISAGGVTWTFTSGGGNIVDLSIGTTGSLSGTLSEFSVQFTGATAVSIMSTNTGWSSVAPGNCVSSHANFWCVSGSPISVPDGTLTFAFDVTGLNLSNGTDVRAFQGQGGLAISTGTQIGPSGPPTATPEPASMLLLGLGLAGAPFLRRRKL